MSNNSKKENITRKKVNYKNYKDLCDKLKLPVYKRGSEEKKKQLLELEKNRNIHMNKDNSFTQINVDFKNKKEVKHENVEAKGTVNVGNHSVFLGRGKYEFERFNNIRNVFLSFIGATNSTSKTWYVNNFFSNCYLFNAITNEEFKNEVNTSKSKSIALDLFEDECRYVFNHFLEKCRDVLGEWVAYYDSNGKMINYLACEQAWVDAVKELDFKFFDFKKRINELYAKVNKILIDNNLNPINKRHTKYYFKDGENNTFNNVGDNYLYMADIVKLYEIMKYTIIRKLRKRSVAFGKPRHMAYELTAPEFIEAKEFIEKYVCYYEKYTQQKYYSVEDIPENMNKAL